MRTTWTARGLAFSALTALAGCGARSELVAPPFDGGAAPAPQDAGARTCPVECFVGHQCCLGDCNGPATTPDGWCCKCLPGEVSTFDCGTSMCGG